MGSGVIDGTAGIDADGLGPPTAAGDALAVLLRAGPGDAAVLRVPLGLAPMDALGVREDVREAYELAETVGEGVSEYHVRLPPPCKHKIKHNATTIPTS